MRFALVTAVVLTAVLIVGALLPQVPPWLAAVVTLVGLPLLLVALRNGREAARNPGSSHETSGRSDGKLACDGCREHFDYYLVHNGFNDSAYAYCDTCGKTALLSGWARNIPSDVDLRIHRPITPTVEEHLAACSCGGRFRADAFPRCPHCRHPLSPTAVTEQIEANAPGTKAGWGWQLNWSGMYAIVIENRLTQDNWTAITPKTTPDPTQRE